MMRKNSSFTLIELLVCIAIIAILAAMLLPALHKMVATGRRTTCMGNIKQLTIGFANYTDAYSGYMPDAASNVHGVWYEELYLQIGGTPAGKWKLLRCPAYPYQPAQYTATTMPYGYNGWCGNSYSGRSKIQQVKRTSQIIAFADTYEAGYDPRNFDGKGSPIGNRHDGYAIGAFIDGHAAVLPSKDWNVPGLVYNGVFNYSTGVKITNSSCSNPWTTDIEKKYGRYGWLTK